MALSESTADRNQIINDVLDGKVPKRVPVSPSVQGELVLQYAGFDLNVEQYSVEKLIEAIDKFSADFDTDTVGAFATHFPDVYKMMEAKSFVMGSDGFMQHPDFGGMNVEDYDAFIEDPYKCTLETIIPRVYPAFAGGSQRAVEAKTKAFFLHQRTMAKLGAAVGEIAKKYNKATASFSGGIGYCPCDFIADQLRCFSGISKDIRRIPEKVEAACWAIVPMMTKAALSKGPKATKHDIVFIPLHMAPFMREKDFLRFWWPQFKQLVDNINAAGYRTNLFLEQDWSRYIDYLKDLPDGQILWAEFGDPKEFKDKLGAQHILTGFYPLNKVKNGTVEECVDESKKQIDILAPGGNYYLCFEKSPLLLADIKPDNLRAVIDTYQQYGRY